MGLLVTIIPCIAYVMYSGRRDKRGLGSYTFLPNFSVLPLPSGRSSIFSLFEGVANHASEWGQEMQKQLSAPEIEALWR